VIITLAVVGATSTFVAVVFLVIITLAVVGAIINFESVVFLVIIPLAVVKAIITFVGASATSVVIRVIINFVVIEAIITFVRAIIIFVRSVLAILGATVIFTIPIPGPVATVLLTLFARKLVSRLSVSSIAKARYTCFS
jgi:hypothetical protein